MCVCVCVCVKEKFICNKHSIQYITIVKQKWRAAREALSYLNWPPTSIIKMKHHIAIMTKHKQLQQNEINEDN